MAEVPVSINNPVISDDALFALNIDTKQRYDNIFSEFKTPIGYPLPQYDPSQFEDGLGQRDLLDSEKMKGSIGDGMFSPDRRISEYATDTLRRRTSLQPTTVGAGVPELLPYSKEMDKYIKGDFGYDPYSTLENNEDFNYKNDYANQSLFGKAWRNALTFQGRLATGVVTKALQGFGYLGSMIWNGIEEIFNPTGNNAMADIADNGLSRLASKWEEDLKSSNALSVFKPAGWEDKGFFSKLGHGAFWTDEVADGAAFMGEMVLSTYLTGGAARLAGLGKLGAKSVNFGSKLGGFGKGLDTAIKFGTGADDLSGIGLWAFNTASESAFEASEGYKRAKEELEYNRSIGLNNLSDAQIEQQSGDIAASRFKGNMLVLSLSNAFENRMIFQPLFRKVRGVPFNETPSSRLTTVSESIDNLDELAKASRRTYSYTSKAGRYTDWKNPNSRLRFYGKRALQATAAEGFWEENAQLAIERLTATDSLTLPSFTGQITEQTWDAIRGEDTEASTAIGLGTIIGVGGVTAVSKVAGGNRWFQGERRAIEENLAGNIAEYEKYRKQFLSFNDAWERKDGKIVVDEFGNPKYDESKLAGIIQGIAKFANKQAAIDKISDPFFKQNIQDDVIMDFVYAAKKAGIYDKSLSRFEGLKGATPTQIEELGFDPNTTVDSQAMIDSIREVGDKYEIAQESKTKLPDTKKETLLDEENRKYSLFKSLSRSYSANKIAAQYEAAFRERAMGTPISDAEGSDVQEYNSLLYQREALKQTRDALGDNTGFYKEYYNSELKRLDDRIAEIKEAIDPKIKDRSVRETPSGILTTPRKYSGLSEDERAIALDIENQNQIKAGELRNAESKENYLSDKLSNPVRGLENYREFNRYIKSIQTKDKEADDKKFTVKENEDKTFTVIDETGAVVGTPHKTKEEAETAIKSIQTPQPQPVQTTTPVATSANIQKTTDVSDHKDADIDTITDPNTVSTKIADEISVSKPVSWEFPNITSKRDTENLSPEVEQLVDIQYDIMRADFIKKFVNEFLTKHHKLFIVKDTFPELYKQATDKYGNPIAKQNEKGEWVFTDPQYQGEVIILETDEGTRPTVKDFFQDKYRDISDLPIVFSFDLGLDGGMFMQQPLYDIRAGIKSAREEVSIAEVKKGYEDEMRITKKAREFVRSNPASKIEIGIVDSTTGIHPKTKDHSSVQSRFGEFSIEISMPISEGMEETSAIYGTQYPKGMVVAKIPAKKFAFPVSTLTISEYPEIYTKIKDVLAYKFKTREEAERVRNDMLSVYIATSYSKTAKSFFRIDQEGEEFVIKFMKAKPEDVANKKISIAEKRANAIESDVSSENLNVSLQALRGGYLDFNPTTGQSQFHTKEEYEELIKPRLMTNLKKVVDKKGSLYTETVNPYFSFLVTDGKIPETGVRPQEEIQNENYSNLSKRMENLRKSGTLDTAKFKITLDDELRKNNINKLQHEDLISKVAPAKKEEPKKEVGQPVQVPVQPKEEEKPKEEVKKSITEKYKDKERKDIAKTITQKPQAQTTEFKVRFKTQEILYNPIDNLTYLVSAGTLEPYTTAISVFGQIMEEFARVYPFTESESGNTGFNKLEVVDKEGSKYTIFAPPTNVANSEIIISPRGVQYSKGLVELKKEVAPEELQKLDDFIKRYC